MARHTDEPAPDPAEDRMGENLPLIELETILSRPPSQRKRLAQLGFVLLAAVIALALFWGSIVPQKPAAPAAAPTPTSSPPMLRIFSSINYGTLTINGKKQSGQLPLSIDVHTNTYDISLDAPPFRPVSCHLRLTDLNSSGNYTGNNHCLGAASLNFSPEFQVYILLTPNDLPPGQQHQVTAMLSQAITIQQDVSVPVGSYFVTDFQGVSNIASQRASEPLEARASVAPSAPPNPEGSLPCAGFVCSGTIFPGTTPLTGQQWEVEVELALRWRFSTASGAVVSDVLFQGDDPYAQVEASIALFLSLDGAGDWTISQNAPTPDVSSQLQDSFCSVGENILQQVASPGPNGNTTILHDLGAQGCEWLMQVNGVDQGTFLWRFGVLLAVDAKTHAAYPDLPVAPPEEVAAVTS